MQLAAIRAQEYPRVIDNNGLPWEHNAIRRLEIENGLLRQALEEIYYVQRLPESAFDEAVAIAGKALKHLTPNSGGNNG